MPWRSFIRAPLGEPLAAAEPDHPMVTQARPARGQRGVGHCERAADGVDGRADGVQYLRQLVRPGATTDVEDVAAGLDSTIRSMRASG